MFSPKKMTNKETKIKLLEKQFVSDLVKIYQQKYKTNIFHQHEKRVFTIFQHFK